MHTHTPHTNEHVHTHTHTHTHTQLDTRRGVDTSAWAVRHETRNTAMHIGTALGAIARLTVSGSNGDPL